MSEFRTPLVVAQNFPYYASSVMDQNSYTPRDEKILLKRQRALRKTKDPIEANHFSSTLQLYASGYKVQKNYKLADKIRLTMQQLIPLYSIPLLADKPIFRGASLPKNFINQVENIFKKGDLTANQDISNKLLHGMDGKSQKICSTSTSRFLAEEYAFKNDKEKSNQENILFKITPTSDKPAKAVTMETGFLALHLADRTGHLGEHEVILDHKNNDYQITNFERKTHVKDGKIVPYCIIELAAKEKEPTPHRGHSDLIHKLQKPL